MNRPALIASAAACVVAVGATFPNRPAVPPVDGWHYRTLICSGDTWYDSDVPGEGRPLARLVAEYDPRTLRYDTFGELVTDATPMSPFDYLGAQGWELVTHVRTPASVDEWARPISWQDTWTFKRPAHATPVGEPR